MKQGLTHDADRCATPPTIAVGCGKERRRRAAPHLTILDRPALHSAMRISRRHPRVFQNLSTTFATSSIVISEVSITRS